ncbi:MAG: hypothetical protein JW892_04900 [Anaerolineae bacterium]|nr:hypothetical protein [Anaerolineae bacterium]
MQEIAPNIYMEDRLAPYNLGVVVTEHGVIAIDMPPQPSQARIWLEELHDSWGQPRFLVLSDAQPERLIGAALAPMPMIVTQATAQCLTAFDDKTWPEMLHGIGQIYPDEAEALADLHPRHPTLVLDQTLYLHYTTPPLRFEALTGNMPGSLMLTLPEQKILFAGDTVVVGQPPDLRYTSDFSVWLKTLTVLARRKDLKWIVPGRGSGPILRGELETQQEFMHALEHAAGRLARKADNSEGMAQATTDLQQVFFPHAARGSAIHKTLRQGLELLASQKRAQRLEAAAQKAEQRAAESLKEGPLAAEPER